jgi:FOG: FHA domain
MQGYRVRFEQGRGHQMMLEGEPPLRSEELDRLQLRMLTGMDGIPGVLPIQAEELDGVVSFRYSLKGSRMLSQTFRVERWTMEEALEALAQLAEILEQANEHMLDVDRFLLEDEFIFAGPGRGELSVTYVPAVREFQTVGFAARMERLIIRWMMNVELPDGPVLQKLLRQAASADFSPVDLRKLIRQLMNPTRSDTDASGLSDLRSAPQAVPRAESILDRREASAWEERARASSSPPLPEVNLTSSGEPPAKERLPQPNKASISEAQSLSGLLGEEPSRWGAERNRVENEGKASSRWRTWLLAGAGGFIAVAWRFAYLPQPGRRGLILASGATLLAVGAVIFLWNGWAAGGKSRRLPEVEEDGGNGSDRDIDGSSWEAANEFGDRPASDPEPPKTGRFGKAWLPSGTMDAEPFEHVHSSEIAGRNDRKIKAIDPATTWLRSDPGTMLLSESESSPSTREKWFLEWEQDGASRKIRLSGDSLVIGRSKEVSQHVDETPGVSRAHLELLREADRWRAKDLGSRNGSWLNGVPMAPYEAYPLARGDSLQIASSLYRLREETKPVPY